MNFCLENDISSRRARQRGKIGRPDGPAARIPTGAAPPSSFPERPRSAGFARETWR